MHRAEEELAFLELLTDPDAPILTTTEACRKVMGRADVLLREGLGLGPRRATGCPPPGPPRSWPAPPAD